MATGRPLIQSQFAQTFPLGSGLSINSEKVEISGNLAYDVGTFTQRVAPPNAKPMDMTGHYLVVLKRDGGNWRIVRHMSYMPVTAKP